MKQNSIYLKLLGDFYSDVASGSTISGIDEIHTKMIHDRYSGIVSKYIYTKDIMVGSIEVAFIDLDSFQYDNTIKIVDINKSDILNATAIVLPSGEVVRISVNSSGRYEIPDEVLDDIKDKAIRFTLVHITTDEEMEKRVLSGNTKVSLDSETIEFLNILLTHNLVSKSKAEDVANILLGSPFVKEVEEEIMSISDGNIYTDTHIYSITGFELLVAVQEGDIVKFGTPLLSLCSYVVADNRSSSIAAINHAISTNGESPYLKALYSSISKSTISIEIAQSVFSDTPKSVVTSVGKILEGYHSLKVVTTIAPTVEITNTLCSESHSNCIVSNEQATASEINSHTVMSSRQSECSVEESGILILLSTPIVDVDGTGETTAEDLVDTQTATVEAVDTYTESSSDITSVVNNDELIGSETELVIGGVEDTPYMINLFSDTTTMSSDSEASDYLISSIVVTSVDDIDTSTVQSINTAITTATEVPVYGILEVPIITGDDSETYESTIVSSETAGLIEDGSHCIVTNELANQGEESVKTLIDTEIISPLGTDTLSGVFNTTSTISSTETDMMPIVPMPDTVTVTDLVFVEGDTQIDF